MKVHEGDGRALVPIAHDSSTASKDIAPSIHPTSEEVGFLDGPLCNKCGTVLNKTTWRPSDQQHGWHRCRDCVLAKRCARCGAGLTRDNWSDERRNKTTHRQICVECDAARFRCRKCGHTLTAENWSPSRIKNNNYMSYPLRDRIIKVLRFTKS